MTVRPKHIAVADFRCARRSFVVGDEVTDPVVLDAVLRFGDRFVTTDTARARAVLKSGAADGDGDGDDGDDGDDGEVTDPIVLDAVTEPQLGDPSVTTNTARARKGSTADATPAEAPTPNSKEA